MQINNHQIVDYDAVLDAKFGAEGTPERAEAEEKAYAFYTGQIIEDARKKAKITQAELARRIILIQSVVAVFQAKVLHILTKGKRIYFYFKSTPCK